VADSRMCGEPMHELIGSSRAQRVEFGVLFALMVPFFGWMVRHEGPLQGAGFALTAAVIIYIIWFSPHRKMEPAARRSLLEVPIMLAWSMTVIWVILPWGALGKVVGNTLIGATVCYVLFVARWIQGDSWEDWGLGSPADFCRYVWSGEHRHAARLAFFTINLALVAACWFADGAIADILRRAARRAFGFRRTLELPFPLLVAAAAIPLNLLIVFCRYDNLRAAGRLLGWYFLIGSTGMALTAYLYIYQFHDGWVEVRLTNGLVGMASYAIWGTLQELLFLGYFNTRIRKGLSSPLLSALLTAIVFGLFHLTAYTLMAICFLVMIVWALIFQAAPNVILMGIVHGISGGFGSAFSIQGMPPIRIKASVGPFNR
jgi:hypothetical protein